MFYPDIKMCKIEMNAVPCDVKKVWSVATYAYPPCVIDDKSSSNFWRL